MLQPGHEMIRNRSFDVLGLAFSIVLTFGVATFAAQFEPGDWYVHLAKPAWTPPGWLFGPVWGMLYLAMSISAWLVWRQRHAARVSLPLGIYFTQLAINGTWSWLFFGQQWINLALVNLIVLVILVAVTVAMFQRVRKAAGLMLIPYLLWISFATALNFQIWRVN